MLDPIPDLGSPSVRPHSSPVMRRVIRRICTANPFYALSAVLVLLGLRMSCDPEGVVFPTWAMLAGLAAYTLLLAFTAAGLVRYLGVWDDVRTLLLLVVMILTAIPAFFDDILARNPQLGVSCELGGLAFAMIVSEGLLRAIRLRLPLLFRIPYHVLLALIFLHPVALAPYLQTPSSPSLLWLLLAFPTAAGLSFLLLLPAIRRGPSYVANNGSPWGWPLYPWSLFAILGVAIVARTYSICLSVNYSGGTGRYEGIYATIFGPYFLIPLLLAVAALILEAGLVTKRRASQAIGLVMPAALVLLATLGHRSDPSYERLLGLFRKDLGATPLYLTLLAAGFFYAVAAYRRVPAAIECLSGVLAVSIVLGPGSLDLRQWVAPQVMPLVGLATLQAIIAARQGCSWRAGLASLCVAAASFQEFGPASPSLRLLIAVHVALGCLIGIILFFHDPFSRFVRKFTAIVLASLALAAISGLDVKPIPTEIVRLYPLLPMAIAAVIGLFLADSAFFLVGLAVLGCSLGAWGWQGYALARRSIVGLDQITAGLTSFVVAAGISLWKAGAFAARPDAQRKPLAFPGPSLAETLPGRESLDLPQ